jgi:hypothetical protein
MYAFIKSLGLKKFLISEMPALGLSLMVSELAFKFGSFILECGAFLTTWYFFSLIIYYFPRTKQP